VIPVVYTYLDDLASFARGALHWLQARRRGADTLSGARTPQ